MHVTHTPLRLCNSGNCVLDIVPDAHRKAVNVVNTCAFMMVNIKKGCEDGLDTGNSKVVQN